MRKFIESLEEAKYSVDRDARDTAELFYDALVDYVKKNPDGLVKRKDGSFSVHAINFWRDPLATDLGVIFSPRSGRMKGGIGRAGRMTVLVLPVLRGPGDKKYLATQIDKKTVVHEMTHFLDPGYGSGGIRKYEKKSGKVDYEKYYNDPSEWNAFWQEGASSWETILGFHHKNEKAILNLFGGGSLSGALGKAGMFWDKDFLRHMNNTTKRKFYKRFSQLWSAAKEKGLL